MKKELIYIWINQDEHGCFQQRGFNFSPLFDVSYDVETQKISINRTGDLNPFLSPQIVNLSAVVGENGTGKTTLLNFLNTLSDTPISEEERDEYRLAHAEQNEKRKYIAVYYEHDVDDVKIINITQNSIWLNDEEIKPYGIIEFRAGGYMEDISHIYVSNSEYNSDNSVLHQGTFLKHMTFSNDALCVILRKLYLRLYFAPDGMIENKKFNILQIMFMRNMNNQKSQMLLDVLYYHYLANKGLKFCGKEISEFVISLAFYTKIINKDSIKINYTTEYAEKKFLDDVDKAFKEEMHKVQYEKEFYNTLVFNLIYELIYVFDFKLTGENLSVDAAYDQCCKYIREICDEQPRVYYLAAIEEIDNFRKIIDKADVYDNNIPIGDLARKICARSTIQDICELIAQSIDKGSSFIIKYLHIDNLEMSSGERALLNIMSRLYLASQMSNMMPEAGFDLHENVLLLIDEVDLYMHPEWQRRIIADLLNELKVNFPNNHFQIIITSHSPILLSDIPSQNTVFLKRVEGNVVQIPHEIQTFGANIHSLYKDAFFIKDGLAMGEYARSYIDNIICEIKTGIYNEDEIKQKISLIGEPVIRKKLFQLLGKPKSPTIPMLEVERRQMIEFLRNQKKAVEHQIALLEQGLNDD